MLYWLLLWVNNANGVQNAEIQGQLNAIRNQMSDNQNSNLLMDAVKGNNNAITQLASNLNCDFNSLNNAICAVRSGIKICSRNTMMLDLNLVKLDRISI